MAETRSEADILGDLRSLCCQPGFIHTISFLIFRDFFLTVDREGTIEHGIHPRYSRSRLNHNELVLLVGLIVQCTSTIKLEDVADTEALACRASDLLEEFHTSLEAPMHDMLTAQASGNHSGDLHSLMAREAIYYGAGAAFNHQYQTFARERYRNDFEWMLANKGLSIRPMIDIARFIADQVNGQITYLGHACAAAATPITGPIITRGLMIEKKALFKRFGRKAAAFLDAFSIATNNANVSFNTPFAFNEATAKPILDFGDRVYLTSQRALFESIYASPFYWMLSDPKYKDTAAENRGTFLERTVTRMLQGCFGERHVYANAIVKRSRTEIAAEADVLVVYGEFVLVVQTKSKRLTLAARGGDPQALDRDFRDAVQSACEQGDRFADLLISGYPCEITQEDVRCFKFWARVFTIVVLSDDCPSLMLLYNRAIGTTDRNKPIVADIFFLDVMLRILRDPIEVLYYLQQRSRFFDKVMADSEFNLLGFHVKHKLYVGNDVTFALIDQDFSADIDDYIIGLEVGRQLSVQFPPLEERIEVPRMGELLKALKSGPPEIAGTIVELLDFSKAALEGIAENVEICRAEVMGGKPFKAFSVETYYGGITYLAARMERDRAKALGHAIARRYKYQTRKNRWYVLLDDVESANVIDAILPICEEWQRSTELEEESEEIGKLLKSTYVPFKRSDSQYEEDPGDRPETA